MRLREIPYNYTSYSDREIVIRLLGESMWEALNRLRKQRRTGRSARMLFEILGDIWMVTRNPLIQDDLLADPTRQASMTQTLRDRIKQMRERAGKYDPTTEVHTLIDNTEEAVYRFDRWLRETSKLREDAHRRFARDLPKDNVDFSGTARVAHVTDATDWRVAYPFVVLTPDTEAEVALAVRACIDLDLIIVPRGGGTGYTGSAIPLYENTAVINMEKLIQIDPVTLRDAPGVENQVATLFCGAGAVTQHVSNVAAQSGYVFAVDPTSQSSCTIGGNIAMNAGGKKAVLWGTALDNLLSWRMVEPTGNWLEVTRLNHNLGKIHDVPEATFRVSRYGADGRTPTDEPYLITIPAHEIRKPGLGKDVTNKTLRGLPGIQKEGCDGMITSAVFVVHKMPAHTRTVALEFFGYDLSEAVPAIVEIKEYLDGGAGETRCAGLEHLDDRYIKAVGYNTKSSRQQQPKMVLISDIVGNDEEQVHAAAEHVVKLTQARNGEGFIAITPTARKRFWADRSRTAAIAAHTNAFKVNEDVVIPLDKLAEYSAGIERINIEHSIHNKLRVIATIRHYLSSGAFGKHLPKGYPASSESKGIIHTKVEAALQILDPIAHQWQRFLGNLDTPCGDMQTLLAQRPVEAYTPQEPLLNLLLRHALRISYRSEVAGPVKNLLSGELWDGVRSHLDHLHQEVRSSRLFVALHMHAGDGNIHTNIPVNSNDYQMLASAEEVVDQIMALATGLGGVISGEHGIGITKAQYISEEAREAFREYKRHMDPADRFNRGKLTQSFDLSEAYTPSLRLVQQEALILRESALGDLNDMVRNCLRCGKCKPHCSTHVPQANLLYSPRNKILAAGLMIEAFLYEEQTRRGISVRHFEEMNDLADHCTVCHKCFNPCPVNIDFGKVTMAMRGVLNNRKQRVSSLGSKLAMQFLNTNEPKTIKFMRSTVIAGGFKAQRLAHNLAKNSLHVGTDKEPLPGNSTGRPPVHTQAMHLIRRPLPEHLPPTTMRNAFNLEDGRYVPLLSDPHSRDEGRETVFYFPGCGCERLFSEVSMAVLAMLNHVKVNTVLPPTYACCGYPQASAGQEELSRKITTDNRVLFHRVANQLNYLDIKTVLVSCGTCLTQLEKYEFEAIFPGCRLMDIHEFLMEKGITLGDKGTGRNYLFHDPCHTPSKVYDAHEVVKNITQANIAHTDRCCGEAGTFAVSRPDVSTQVRFIKEASIRNSRQALALESQQPVTLLTTCPACVQGLSRYSDTTHTKTRYVVQELADLLLGADWQQQLERQVQNGWMEKILL
ncbi:FAD linked oxidase domain protein [Magnetococcus marinus MC-1]|uniref:FAD linked oxidase domain protein n=1 Tax=Magnetococcus marinus (strain ATCC BAA-1437 / JCM 17883 / MC-1) TaxID=156889 RepID=A0L8Y3_MAGMM|nr:FAD/FMN-binding oxidoreductase [Magnetococcus marinus]ABK44426.1 FAD linked oxidase domain protein [Magnetococcus marinus MC-1]